MKKFYIENLGCSKNQVDAEMLIKQLEEDALELTESASEADLILVNTCGFIESAREQSIEAFFTLHEANPDAKIILSGCMAQRYADQLREQLNDEATLADTISQGSDFVEIGGQKAAEEIKNAVAAGVQTHAHWAYSSRFESGFIIVVVAIILDRMLRMRRS